MPKITNSTLLAECSRLAAVKQWDKGDNWRSKDMAICVLRTVLNELGASEYLTDEHKEARADIVSIIAPCFTAPVNFRREYLTPSALAPEMAKAAHDDKAQLAMA